MVSIASQVNTDATLFIAIRGTKYDGHNFIDEAFHNGANLCVVENADSLKGRAGIIVKDSRYALSFLADLFAGEPSKKLKVIGVTGTNGKTTIHWMIYHLLKSLGKKVLRVGTIGSYAEGIVDDPGSLTTPDPISLHRLFNISVVGGIEYAVMEVSSHALEQHRVEHVRFCAGIFSNLTRDHLDYHETMERYALAKQHLFEIIGTTGASPKLAVINGDDSFSNSFVAAAMNSKCKVVTFSENNDTDWKISEISPSITGSVFTLSYRANSYQLECPFIGTYNIQNLVSALVTILEFGFSIEKLIDLVKKLPQVPGRLESVGQNGIGVYVDYAHTPDALENALSALRPLTKKKLWVVFGCGGDRDKGKRPQMARAAIENADKIVVTSDNPRTEDPKKIIDDILSEGVTADYVNVERREAINFALSEATLGDIVLIAGKGHENYQIIGTTSFHFSDVEVVKEFFKGA